MTKAEKWAPILNPALEPGEIIEHGVMGAIGKISLKDQLKTAAIATVLTLGTWSAYLQPRPAAFVLTNRRMIIFSTDDMGIKPTQEILASLSFGEFSFRRIPSLLLRKYDLVHNDGTFILTIFPMTQGKAADELVRRINSSSR